MGPVHIRSYLLYSRLICEYHLTRPTRFLLSRISFRASLPIALSAEKLSAVALSAVALSAVALSAVAFAAVALSPVTLAANTFAAVTLAAVALAAVTLAAVNLAAVTLAAITLAAVNLSVVLFAVVTLALVTLALGAWCRAGSLKASSSIFIISRPSSVVGTLPAQTKDLESKFRPPTPEEIIDLTPMAYHFSAPTPKPRYQEAHDHLTQDLHTHRNRESPSTQETLSNRVLRVGASIAIRRDSL
eukprot:IDg4778t1